MKAVWTVITLLLLVNALALAGGAGWLVHSGRLNQDRMDQIQELLSLTVEQEQAQTLKAQRLEEESRQTALEIARLESVSDGPVTLADRLATEQRRDELAVQRVERLRRDISDMRHQLTLAQSLLEKKQQALDAQQAAFDEAVQRQAALQEDEDFQLTVQMLQRVKPKQGKEIFQQLLKQGHRSQVVDYLAAMQLRKAAAVLKMFKGPDEIIQATDLLQALRARGVELASIGSAGLARPQQGVNPG